MAQAAQINREELAEHVCEDSDLSPAEKETNIAFAKPGDEARVYSEEAGITRRLLQHPEFSIDMLRVTTDKISGKRTPPEAFDGGEITGVRGYIPVGCLKVRANARNGRGHADVVSPGR